MDIRIGGLAANAAISTIFGEDVSKGPVFKAPPVLAQFIRDWPGHRDDIVSIGLEPPPRCPINGFKVSFHRVDIVSADSGKFLGHALRMDNTSLCTLNAWASAWSTHRRNNAH